MDFTIDDVIDAASPVERVVPLCVAGKLVAEHERLVEELANTPPPQRLGSKGPHHELSEAIATLEAEMTKRTFPFRFRALTPKAWSDLIAAHPDKSAKRLAFDPDTFPTAAISATCVEPAGMDDPVKAAALLDQLSTAQQNLLFDAAWDVNATVPKGPSSSSGFDALLDYAKSFGSATSEASPEASSSAA